MKDFLTRFTPSLMSHETLEAIFVQREKLAQSLVERVRDSALTAAKHYVLLIGPRGMGKTHLVALVYHRVTAMEDVRDRLRIAWLREEEWVTSFVDLLLRILRALAEEYDDADLAAQTEELYALSLEEAERAAADLLVEYLDGRVLLVLIENLDEIFRGLKLEGQQQLRAFLQNQGNTMMLATAQSLFNGVSLRTSPFYGFFNVQHLKQLDIDDAVRLLTKIAEHDEDTALVAFLQTPKGRARVRAVHHLVGGNPRVYLIFAQFLNRETLDDLVEPFMQMLDDLTPYYQSRMLYLSPQQRKIVEFLIENRGAAPVKLIAQRCFLTHQTATSQLKTLRDTGYVQSESAGRESFYELREPLMRLTIEVKKQRGKPIRLLLDFLRLWYTRTELEDRLAMLQPEAALEREYVQYALEMMDAEAKDPRVEACLKDLRSYFEKEDHGRSLQVAEELIELRGDACDWFYRGLILVTLKRYKDALAMFEKAQELPSEAVETSFLFNVITRSRLLVDKIYQQQKTLVEKREKAFEVIEKQFHLSSYDDSILISSASILCFLSPFEKEESLQDHIARVVSLFEKYQSASLLSAGLVKSIGVDIDFEMQKLQKQFWEEAVGDREEFQLPLRLFDAAIRYRETEDQRVLLELPAEERRILEEMLGSEEKVEG